jgi:RNA polymerase sigma-70 factor (ECF subfamily)
MPLHSLADAQSGAGSFQTTRWSMVLAAGGAGTPEAHAAIAQLCRTYWYPLYLFIRRTGRTAPDAEDLVQSFFASLLERGSMAEAEMSRGRFRSFLLGRLDHFLIDDWRRARREKRGGGEMPVSLDDPAIEERVRNELSHELTPATLFDRAWAATLLDRAVARVGAECDAGCEAGRFEVLKGFLVGGRGETPLAEAAQQLGLSIAAVKSVVHRLRERFREVVREEVAQTVEHFDQVDDELRWLLTTIAAR